MSVKRWVQESLIALTLIPATGNAALDFDCLYDPSPLPYGPNPTLFSELKLDASQATVFDFANILSTATAPPSFTTGPQSHGVQIPNIAKAWVTRWIFVGPPYTATYSLQSYGKVWFYIGGGTPVFYPNATGDFCAAQGLVSPQP